MIAALLRRVAGVPGERRAPACGGCLFFDNDPHRLEAALPGLSALSSAMAAVRSDDGLCGRHGRYLRARACCGDFESR